MYFKQTSDGRYSLFSGKNGGNGRCIFFVKYKNEKFSSISDSFGINIPKELEGEKVRVFLEVV